MSTKSERRAVAKSKGKSSPAGAAWGLVDVLPYPVLLLDANDRFAFVNRAAESLLGVTAAELLAKPWGEVLALSPAEPAGVAGPYDEEAAADEAHYLLTRPDGSRCVVQITDTPVPGVDAMPIHRMVTLRDCTVAWDRVRQLEHHCARDHLTSLVNRREFERRLARVLRRAHEDGSTSALVFMDLDGFKSVNDDHGHLAGDRVLQQVAEVLAGAVRIRDTLARLGGDEFGLLMEHCGAVQAVKAANTLVEILRRHRFTWEGRELRIGISMGLTVIDRHSPDCADLLAQADLACYSAKQDPHNKVRLYGSRSDRSAPLMADASRRCTAAG